MLVCTQCQKSFKDKRTLGFHFARMHHSEFETELDFERAKIYMYYGKDSVESEVLRYKNGEISVYECKIDIGKYLALIGLKRTSKEERATPRYKKKMVDSIMSSYGVENCSQSPIVKAKKVATIEKNYGSYKKYLDMQRKFMREGYDLYIKSDKHPATMLKIAETCLERYGHENFGQGELAKAKNHATKMATIATWDAAERFERTMKAREKSVQTNVSSIEFRVRDALTALGIQNQVYNKFLFKFNYDIIFDKTIIEVQGTLWHAKPTIYKPTDLILGKRLASDIWEYDKKKKEIAEKNGYVVKYIWEDDIRKARTPDELINLVERILYD